MSERVPFVIVVGTDPRSKLGGIGFALPGYLEALRSAKIEYISIPTYHPEAPGGSWWWWLKAFPRLGRSIFAVHKRGKQVVVYSHPGAGFSLMREMFVTAFARILGARTVSQIHAPEVAGYLKHPLKNLLFRIAILPASGLAVLTPWWKRTLLSAGVRKSIFVIPNSLPLQWEETAKRLRQKGTNKEGPLVVLTLSRVVPGKGVDLVVEAMPLLPENLNLVIAGDGSQLAEIKQRVQELGIANRVRFVGWVSGDEKQCLFDESDIFCLPSSHDSFGMGFLEAMANGLPVVALNWGPISDVVADKRCGILINEKKPQMLVDAIIRLQDVQLRQSMGEEAKKWVLEQFGNQVVSKNIREMVQSICG